MEEHARTQRAGEAPESSPLEEDNYSQGPYERRNIFSDLDERRVVLWRRRRHYGRSQSDGTYKTCGLPEQRK